MNVNLNTDRHFKGQLENETVECFCRKHWIVLTRDILGFLIFIVVLIFSIVNFRGVYTFFSQDSSLITFMAFSIVSLFTLYIHHFFLRIIRYYLEVVIITNYRIVDVDKSLYLRDAKDAIDIAKIQDIKESRNGILKKMLNFGELIITLSSTATTKTLNFIPNPGYHFRKINELKREYIKKGLSKEDVHSKKSAKKDESISGLS
ncbi:hypothetical protein C0416_04110 [bacterium]|nr:hypothetical protein [bacterium]